MQVSSSSRWFFRPSSLSTPRHTVQVAIAGTVAHQIMGLTFAGIPATVRSALTTNFVRTDSSDHKRSLALDTNQIPPASNDRTLNQ